MEDKSSRKEPESNFRGLYKHVRISVRTLDKFIIGGIILLIALVLYAVANNGYTVTFDSNGGTDVPAQTDLMYSDLVSEPEPPTREGYTFKGWYFDENCIYEWDFETSQVGQSMTLYADWEPNS